MATTRRVGLEGGLMLDGCRYEIAGDDQITDDGTVGSTVSKLGVDVV